MKTKIIITTLIAFFVSSIMSGCNAGQGFSIPITTDPPDTFIPMTTLTSAMILTTTSTYIPSPSFTHSPTVTSTSTITPTPSQTQTPTITPVEYTVEEFANWGTHTYQGYYYLGGVYHYQDGTVVCTRKELLESTYTISVIEPGIIEWQGINPFGTKFVLKQLRIEPNLWQTISSQIGEGPLLDLTNESLYTEFTLNGYVNKHPYCGDTEHLIIK